MKARKQKTWQFYTTCAFCGTPMSNGSTERMSCVGCPKRPQPIDQYAEGLYSVSVYAPANSAGVDFPVLSEFMMDL